MSEQLRDDQIYFRISDSDKSSPEQLTDDSQVIPHSSQVNTVPPINITISYISTKSVTESLNGSTS